MLLRRSVTAIIPGDAVGSPMFRLGRRVFGSLRTFNNFLIDRSQGIAEPDRKRTQVLANGLQGRFSDKGQGSAQPGAPAARVE
jgi:hypothetical protein